MMYRWRCLGRGNATHVPSLFASRRPRRQTPSPARSELNKARRKDSRHLSQAGDEDRPRVGWLRWRPNRTQRFVAEPSPTTQSVRNRRDEAYAWQFFWSKLGRPGLAFAVVAAFSIISIAFAISHTALQAGRRSWRATKHARKLAGFQNKL